MLEKKLSENLINYIASSIIVYLTPDCCICFHFAETESVIVSSHRTMSSEYSRLPPDIRPSHYKLRLEPNFETFKFNGSVDITVDPGGDGEISEIAINANKLVIHSLSVKRSIVTSSLHVGSILPRGINYLSSIIARAMDLLIDLVAEVDVSTMGVKGAGRKRKFASDINATSFKFVH